MGTLKKYLGLQRNAKIPISLIPKIEEKLKSFQINIIGDYTYSSQVKSNKVISLILDDEHYSVNRNIDNSKIKNYLHDFKFTPLYEGLKTTIDYFEKNYNFIRK